MDCRTTHHAEPPRQGDIFQRADGKTVLVCRALPGGKYEVRIDGGGKTLLGMVRKDFFACMTKTGRAA